MHRLEPDSSVSRDELAAHPLRVGLSTTFDVNLRDQSASVLALRDAGARVIATDLHIEALHDIPGIHALPLDVTRAADTQPRRSRLRP